MSKPREFGIRVPADVADALDRHCQATNTLRSRVIVAMLRDYLKVPEPALVTLKPNV